MHTGSDVRIDCELLQRCTIGSPEKMCVLSQLSLGRRHFTSKHISNVTFNDHELWM